MRRKKGLSFYHKEKRFKSSTLREVWSYIFWCFAMAFIAFVIVFSVGNRTSVIGVSMEPTLYNSQTIFMNRLVYMVSLPKRGDVIVFLPNGNKNTHFYVKRVVGLPGETIQIKEGQIYIDGNLLQEAKEYDKIEDSGVAVNPYLLGEDEFFVLGDNRNGSEDSRSANIGSVHKDYIIGKAWFAFGIQDVSMGPIK